MFYLKYEPYHLSHAFLAESSLIDAYVSRVLGGFRAVILLDNAQIVRVNAKAGESVANLQIKQKAKFY